MHLSPISTCRVSERAHGNCTCSMREKIRCDDDLKLEICLGITETTDYVTAGITTPSTFLILAV